MIDLTKSAPSRHTIGTKCLLLPTMFAAGQIMDENLSQNPTNCWTARSWGLAQCHTHPTPALHQRVTLCLDDSSIFVGHLHTPLCKPFRHRGTAAPPPQMPHAASLLQRCQHRPIPPRHTPSAPEYNDARDAMYTQVQTNHLAAKP